MTYRSEAQKKNLMKVRLLTVNAHEMSLLELILIFVLHFPACISEDLFYSTPGSNATLHCGSAASTDRGCSRITWLYNRDRSETHKALMENSKKSSSRAARLSLNTNCSLVIKNIIAEDTGLYTCRQREGDDDNSKFTDKVRVHLSVLTISLSPPGADPKRDGEVTLNCSLLRYPELPPCERNSIRWVDETGTVLLGEGVGYEFRQANCFSYLKVKRQIGHNSRYTCQVVDRENNVKIEADYTPVFTGGEDQPSDHFLHQTYIIIGAVGGVVVVLVVIAAFSIKYKKRAKVTVDDQKPIQHPNEPESSLTYVTVSHANPLAPKKKAKAEEDVTYSTVRLQ